MYDKAERVRISPAWKDITHSNRRGGQGMRIIHTPIEISGQVGLLCGALSRLGHQSVGYNYFRTFHGYAKNLFPTDLFELMSMAGDAAAYFDLFHFHFSMSMLPDYGDMDLIKRLGKPMIMHHWGNDVRMGSIAAAQNPFVYTGSSPKETAIAAKLETISRRISTAIVQDYEVYAYVKPYMKMYVCSRLRLTWMLLRQVIL
jgi:hypothetical protein